jgi:hypothetical protein
MRHLNFRQKRERCVVSCPSREIELISPLIIGRYLITLFGLANTFEESSGRSGWWFS